MYLWEFDLNLRYWKGRLPKAWRLEMPLILSMILLVTGPREICVSFLSSLTNRSNPPTLLRNTVIPIRNKKKVTIELMPTKNMMLISCKIAKYMNCPK